MADVCLAGAAASGRAPIGELVATFRKNLLVTLCALTRTTERAAHRRGVGYFLPALFVDRFANLGGLDKTQFSAQLDACRSFEDEAWAG